MLQRLILRSYHVGLVLVAVAESLNVTYGPSLHVILPSLSLMTLHCPFQKGKFPL